MIFTLTSKEKMHRRKTGRTFISLANETSFFKDPYDAATVVSRSP